MKWKSESTNARIGRIKKWHQWFAWYPVRIGEEIIWLKRLRRKAIHVDIWSRGLLIVWDYEEY